MQSVARRWLRRSRWKRKKPAELSTRRFSFDTTCGTILQVPVNLSETCLAPPKQLVRWRTCNTRCFASLLLQFISNCCSFFFSFVLLIMNCVDFLGLSFVQAEEAKLITELAEMESINHRLFRQAYDASMDVNKFLDQYELSKLLAGSYDREGACITIRAESEDIASQVRESSSSPEK